MNAEKVAELAAQILIAAMQSKIFDTNNVLFVSSYYETIARKISEVAQGTGETTVQ